MKIQNSNLKMKNDNLKFKMIFISAIFLAVLLLPKISLAATINAASCNQTDVQAAINQAQDGDTVLVPEGTCTWTTTENNKPAVTINKKAIVLKGQGIDKTIINDETSNGLSGHWGEDLLVIQGLEGKPFRITNFTFQRLLDDSDTNTCIITISGTSKHWRIDNNKFIIKRADGAVCVGRSFTYGLIDSNELIGSGRISIMADGESSWKRPLSLGSINAVYIENNTFNGYLNDTPIYTNAVDSNYGARYVFRYNNVSNQWAEAHGAQWGRGTFSYEIYSNRFIDGPTSWVPVSVRGGTGVIFNNSCSGFLWGSGKINIYLDRACGPAQLQCACNGTCYLDGNQDSTGWPCLDQIGRSTDASLESIHPQAYEPLYEWDNTNDGNDVDIIPHPGCERNSILLKESRDFYNDTPRPGYTPYTYPHPFRTDCQNYPMLCDSDTTPPSPPKNLTII